MNTEMTKSVYLSLVGFSLGGGTQTGGEGERSVEAQRSQAELQSCSAFSKGLDPVGRLHGPLTEGKATAKHVGMQSGLGVGLRGRNCAWL